MVALDPRRLVAHLRRQGAQGLADGLPQRPQGHVIWVHASADLPDGPLLDLRDRMEDRLDAVTMLRTGPAPRAPAPDVLALPMPQDPGAARSFLAHWRPDAAVWEGDLDPPMLIEAAAKAQLPLFLVNPRALRAESRRARRLDRALLERFTHVLVGSSEIAATLEQTGLAPDRMETTGPLTELPRALPCNERDRVEFAGALGTRPVWLAMMPSEDEMGAVLRAHAQALRGAHRLLLLLVPRDEAGASDLAVQLTRSGWTVARRGADEVPGDSVEIYLADSHEELGLWYRAAPLCFLGGTLSDGACRDPLEGAGLGAALIAGPVGGDFDERLRRLDRAAAIRRLIGPEALGRAIADLIAPDRVATLAHRAWDVATHGADVGDRLAQLLLDALAARGR